MQCEAIRPCVSTCNAMSTHAQAYWTMLLRHWTPSPWPSPLPKNRLGNTDILFSPYSLVPSHAQQVEQAQATSSKIEAELKDLKATLKNIEDARPFNQLTVDDVVAARPEIGRTVDEMVKKGKWTTPGYDEKFGSEYSTPQRRVEDAVPSSSDCLPPTKSLVLYFPVPGRPFGHLSLIRSELPVVMSLCHRRLEGACHAQIFVKTRKGTAYLVQVVCA